MTTTTTPAPANDTMTRLLGGAIGAAIGIGAYWFGLQRSVDILVVVGALPALGIARGSRRRRFGWAVGTAVFAPALALLTMWWFRPFAADESLGYFVSHLAELPGKAWLSLGASALAGAWFGLGRPRRRVA